MTWTPCIALKKIHGNHYPLRTTSLTFPVPSRTPANGTQHHNTASCLEANCFQTLRNASVTNCEWSNPHDRQTNGGKNKLFGQGNHITNHRLHDKVHEWTVRPTTVTFHFHDIKAFKFQNVLVTIFNYELKHVYELHKNRVWNLLHIYLTRYSDKAHSGRFATVYTVQNSTAFHDKFVYFRIFNDNFKNSGISG